MTLLTVLGSLGGLALLLLMAATPLLARLSGRGPAGGAEAGIPARRAAAGPVPLDAA